jgi:hypothetical protein
VKLLTISDPMSPPDHHSHFPSLFLFSLPYSIFHMHSVGDHHRPAFYGISASGKRRDLDGFRTWASAGVLARGRGVMSPEHSDLRRLGDIFGGPKLGGSA